MCCYDGVVGVYFEEVEILGVFVQVLVLIVECQEQYGLVEFVVCFVEYFGVECCCFFDVQQKFVWFDDQFSGCCFWCLYFEYQSEGKDGFSDKDYDLFLGKIRI